MHEGTICFQHEFTRLLIATEGASARRFCREEREAVEEPWMEEICPILR